MRSLPISASLLLVLVGCAMNRPTPQGPPVVGDRVRASWFDSTYRSHRVTGNVASVTAAQLGLRPAERSDTVFIPLNRIETLDRSLGHRRSTGLFAALGGGLGVISGVLVGPSLFCEEHPCSEETGLSPFSDKQGAQVKGAMLFGLGGALIGGLIGSQVRLEAWRPIPKGVYRSAALTPRYMVVTIPISTWQGP